MQRRDFLKAVTVGLGSIASSVRSAEAAPAQPNVLFILTDDQRADYLGYNGHPILKTPNIDSLARRGTYFTHAFATSAICTPSRTCYFLGQWERRHGINFNSGTSLDPKAFENSFPAVLRRAGYFTGYVGKNHVPVGNRGYKSGVLEKQFDYWFANHNHSLFYPKKNHAIFRHAKADTQPEVFLEGAENFLTPNEEFLAGAKEFLTKRPGGKPFCLSVCFNLPHSAGTGSMELRPTDPELYRTVYRDQADKLSPPPTYIAAADIKEPKIPRNVYSGQFIPSYNFVKTREALKERQIRTCQAMTGIDNVVGQLVKQLKTLGLDQNTIIIYASDHGLFFGEHGLGGKALVYEEAIHIPLIVYDPRVPNQPRTEDKFAVPADIAPTIVSLCGIQPPASMQGKSLGPLIRGESVAWREDVFLENLFTNQEYPRIEAVRNKEWKYIRYFRRIPEGAGELMPYEQSLESSIKGEKPIYEELYNLREDPREKRNLAGEARYRKTLDELRTRCGQLVKEAKGAPGKPLTIPL